jgi:transcription elongation factor Elf1
MSDTEQTYECAHCGGETFGLVVKDKTVAYARCRLCEKVVLNG